MQKFKLIALILAIFGAVLLFPGSSLAATPFLSLTNFNGNSVQLSVNGDSNSSVNLYYYSGSSSNNLGVIGSTNSSGYFSSTINGNGYNIPYNSQVYVIVNGQQSNQVAWPYNGNGNNGGSITFSQNNIYLNNGQSTNVTIYGGSGTYYVSSNSDSSLFNAYISGNQLYISSTNNYQNYGGGATIVVCSNGNGGCGSLYINQNGNGNGNYNQITFSQTNISLNSGQGTTVTIYGSGNFYVSYNSNSSVVATNISGNVLNLYGQGSGAATLTVCVNGGNSSCGTLNVNVNNYGYNNGYYGGSTNNGCFYSNGFYDCPNNYNTPLYTTPTAYTTTYGTPSAGVYLNQVPATGINVNLKITLFFLGLFGWSAFLSWIFLTHKKYKLALQEESLK